LKRRAIPIETLHSIDSAWTMDEETAKELYTIHKESGALNMIRQVQPDTAYLVAENFGEEE